MTINSQGLPAALIADELNEQMRNNPYVVVTAPPGAGKSTLLPLTILQGLNRKSEDADTSTSQQGRIVVLEPRRIAARQIATRMAEMLGEEVGNTVGYRVRFESRISAATRIEVVTEGILTRMLIDDTTLEGVSAIIFDEFHERSIHTDVALALTRELQQVLRPDLKVVIMSATIDAAALCQELHAPLVQSKGRMFPVDIRRGKEEAEVHNAAEVTARCILMTHRQHEGDILAFLPGQADIMRCQDLLKDAFPSAQSPDSTASHSSPTTHLCPLYGQLTPAEQHQAIAPSPKGHRKIVLATNIAETSLTIEGVRIVIDSGLCRTMVYDPRNSLSHLQTVPISLDMACQRSGRAGRVAEGVCYRLWSLASEHRMTECRTPELLEADLTPVLLDIAAWQGSARIDEIMNLSWITPPPISKVRQAHQLLRSLHALDDDGRLTQHGRAMSKLPCHPRIAQMLLTARTHNERCVAATIAALLEEKDPLPQYGPSIPERVEHILRSYQHSSGQHSGHSYTNRIHNVIDQLLQCTHTPETIKGPIPYDIAGILIASAYPERIAQLQKDGSYLLANGSKATLVSSSAYPVHSGSSTASGSSLDGHPWLAIASLNTQSGGHIHLAAPLSPTEISSLITTIDNIQWDSKLGRVVMQREQRIGRLIIATSPINDIKQEAIVDIICEAARKDGLSMFDFNEHVQNLQQRVAAVATWHPELGLPDLSTPSVLAQASLWLPFWIGKATSVTELRKIDLCKSLFSLLTYEQQLTVDRLAPTHLTVPTGSRIRVEYRQGAELPILRVRLQECFGLSETPRVDDGKRPVLMELLSPGFKPVQLTQDLCSFWSNTYFEVRKELRRRYPKHYWPDNPLEAEATRGTKKSTLYTKFNKP